MKTHQKILMGIGLFGMSSSMFSIGWITSSFYKQRNQLKIVKIKQSYYNHNNVCVDIMYDNINYHFDDLSYYELNKLIN